MKLLKHIVAGWIPLLVFAGLLIGLIHIFKLPTYPSVAIFSLGYLFHTTLTIIREIHRDRKLRDSFQRIVEGVYSGGYILMERKSTKEIVHMVEMEKVWEELSKEFHNLTGEWPTTEIREADVLPVK